MEWISWAVIAILILLGGKILWKEQRKKSIPIIIGMVFGVVVIQGIGWGILWSSGIEWNSWLNVITELFLIFFLFITISIWMHQSSPIFYSLFFATQIMITWGMVCHAVSLEFGQVLLLFCYFLAENNQFYMKKNYEQSANEYQNKILEKQVQEVQNIYMTMRGWRHDYHNHLQSVKAYLQVGQIEEAWKYLDRLEQDLDQVNQLIETGNIHLDAILNSKISLALKNQIKVDYKAIVPEQLLVTDIDLCVLIGNLIDNAVEACEKIENDNKFIRLYIGVLKKQLYITITNSTNEVVRKLDEEYITTKRGNHGHGLKRINLIVEKYDGFINRKNEPGVFVTEIMLPL